MSTTQTRRALSTLAVLGEGIYDKQVRPILQPADEGKFVAIDVVTGDFMIDEDDYTAITRLQSRNPAADIWLMRIGYPATCRIGAGR